MKTFWVYILTNKSRRSLYIGVTNNLTRRIYEHQHDLVPGFTSKYRIKTLVYAEPTPDAMTAIAREKQLKGWSRSRKERLVESLNPDWHEIPVED